MGLKQLYANHRIFATDQGVHGPMINIWIDNLNLFTLCGSFWMQKIKDMLSAVFKIIDMGPISYYLGLKVEQNRIKKTIKLFQSAYIEKIFHQFGLLLTKTAATSMKKTLLLAPNPEQATPKEIKDFSSHS